MVEMVADPTDFALGLKDESPKEKSENKKRKVGEILQAWGIISNDQLLHALFIQESCRMPLGRVMIGEGWIHHLDLRNALARQQDLPVVDLFKYPPDLTLLKAEHREQYHRYGVLPWRHDGKQLVIVTTNPMNEEVEAWLKEQYGVHRLAMTSPLDIQRSLERAFANIDGDEATLRLLKENPYHSARALMPAGHRTTLVALAVIIFTMAAMHPLPLLGMLAVGAQLFFAAALLFKGLVFGLGIVTDAYSETSAPPLAEDKLPVYTLLVPLYREQKALPGLFRALRALDYPKAKLDIKLIVERDDTETAGVIKALHPESYFEIIYVPPGEPRTKPRACNYALRFAHGELVTIYDAEDRPEPQQLRKAASILAAHEDITCLQARLNYHNYDGNLLTRLFAIEYSAWFNYMLKGIGKLRAPIPLGGTSNHIRLKDLERIGAWDPYNVTEDADLGLRIAVGGGRTALLDSLTLEEAPSKFKIWLRQRTRWIKGYMQTYLVHMRRPLFLARKLGFRGFIGFQLFIGGPTLIFLMTPILWGLVFGWATGLIPAPTQPIYALLAQLTALNLMLGMIVHLWQAAICVKHTRWKAMETAIATFPLYWMLHSVASFRALWHLVTKPYYWEKTPHFHTGIRGLNYNEEFGESSPAPGVAKA